MEFTRAINLPKTPDRSLFLWGPRQSGKSFLLKKLYPNARLIDLLKNEEYIKYSHKPQRLTEELSNLNSGELIIIDEVQKTPDLLNEVHWLIENKGLNFILSGSSARKLKKGAANLLGGRALRFELHGLVSKELGDKFSLNRIINHGSLPDHYLSDNPLPLLESYVSDYLKEEIEEESLVTKLPSFIDFLRAAAITNGEIVEYTNIASDCGVSSATVKNYFEIQVDTLIGFYLPAYVKKAKRRIKRSPKFYFFDVAIVNFLCRRFDLQPGSSEFGHAFESFIVNELRTYVEYSKNYWALSYWKLDSGSEVDIIINDMEIAIEIKAVSNISDKHLKGLREIIKDHKNIKSRIIVSLEKTPRKTKDGIDILPYEEFLNRLWLNDFA